MRQKHRLVAFLYIPQPGMESATWFCALTRNQTPQPSRSQDNIPTNWATLATAKVTLFTSFQNCTLQKEVTAQSTLSEPLCCCSFVLRDDISVFFKLIFGEREERRHRNICCSTYLCIHWLIFVCALTGEQTHNKIGISGQRLTNWATQPVQGFSILKNRSLAPNSTL